jgi:hypothetical protein
VESRFICSEDIEMNTLEYMVNEFENQENELLRFKTSTVCDQSI